MKQERINEVAEAFRKGLFSAVSGGGPITAFYDEAYLDERTDYEFEHMYVHLIKDGREGDLIEVMSVELDGEYMGSRFAPARRFTEFYTRAMERKLLLIRLMMDAERDFEINGVYEKYTEDYAIIAFYLKKMPG